MAGLISSVSGVASCSAAVLVLSFHSPLLIPWKLPLMMTVAASGSFHETLPFLGIRLTCSGVVLCVLVAVGTLVVLDWLALSRFLEPCFSSTMFSLAWAGRFSFSVVCCSALSISVLPFIVGTLFQDWRGSPVGRSTSMCCGGGGMLSMVDSECCCQLMPGLV